MVGVTTLGRSLFPTSGLTSGLFYYLATEITEYLYEKIGDGLEQGSTRIQTSWDPACYRRYMELHNPQVGESGLLDWASVLVRLTH